MSVTSTTSTVNTNNVVDYYTNTEGDLFLKFFLLDSSFNTRGFSVDSSEIERLAKAAIGSPYTDYEDFPNTLFGDGHPWSPKEKATLKDHIDYANDNKTGIIVDFSPVSRNALKSASGHDIENNHGFYATVKILDPVKKELYLKNPERIPRVSPGIFDYNFTPLPAKNLKDVDFVHLAGVRYGAYGEKARLYAKCSGGYECINHLKGASELSSLGEFDTQNKNIMSDQSQLSNTLQQQENVSNEISTTDQQIEQNSGTVPQINNTEKVESQKEETQKETNTNTDKTPFRLKTQKFDFSKTNKEQPVKEEVNKIPDWKQDEEYLKLAKEVEQLKQERELAKSKAAYAEIIPRELFILNGKFDTIGYNKELEKAVSKNIDKEYAKELYSLKLEKLKLSNGKTGKPYGASSVTSYQTPDTVPESKNETNDNSSQYSSLINLRKMVGLFPLGANL